MRGIPSELALDGDDGLPVVCAASFDNITTAPKANLTERITALAPGRAADMCLALRAATAC